MALLHSAAALLVSVVSLPLAACRGPAEQVAATSTAVSARAAIPELVPPATHAFGRGTRVREERFYSFAATNAGANLTIQGTPVVHHDEAPFVPNETRRVRGVRALLFEVDGIHTVTWVEGSVAYAADLECADAADPRCADETYLFAVVESLTVAGDAR